MGTRRWNEQTEKYSVGQVVFVRAGFFDSGGSSNEKYSSCFKFKEDTLLEGMVLSVHQSSVRVKFKIDDSTATVKCDKLIQITDENRHFIFSGKLFLICIQVIINMFPHIHLQNRQ